MPEIDAAAAVFAEHRPVLVGAAYRILGSVGDAEDVTQEAWLRWAEHFSPEIREPRAYLIRVTTRLAIDRLRQVRARREAYFGPWLPEPLAASVDPSDDPGEVTELAESVSMALLVVLETLSPLERAVFVLREAFAMPHAEIAEVLGRSEVAVRQLARRARDHVDERRPRYDTDPAARRKVTERFLAACETADFAGLMALLAPDVTLVGDGGGAVPAPRHPLDGPARIARLLTGGRGGYAGAAYRAATINGEPGVIVVSAGTPVAAVQLELRDGLICTIHIFGNPAKLAGIR